MNLARGIITAPGMYFDMAAEDYFSEPCPVPALSNSGINTLLNQSPQHFAHNHPAIGQPREEREATVAMHRGSVVHRLALGAGKDYSVIDAKDFRGGEAQEAKKHAIKMGRVPILKHQFIEAQQQANILRAHLDELFFGEQFLSEVVIAWQIETPHGLIWARGMIDAWCPTLMKAVDLKSTTDASEEAITRKMANEGYDRQDVWYRKGLEHLLNAHGKTCFVTLFCETKPPFASHPITINEAWGTSAWDMCEEAIDIFARCMKAGEWPGYPRTARTLFPPDWLINKRINRKFSLEA